MIIFLNSLVVTALVYISLGISGGIQGYFYMIGPTVVPCLFMITAYSTQTNLINEMEAEDVSKLQVPFIVDFGIGLFKWFNTYILQHMCSTNDPVFHFGILPGHSKLASRIDLPNHCNMYNLVLFYHFNIILMNRFKTLEGIIQRYTCKPAEVCTYCNKVNLAIGLKVPSVQITFYKVSNLKFARVKLKIMFYH